jgi:predicted site-specific integrase-resolvase
MSKIGTLNLTGVSGTKYEFNVYSFDTSFNSISTVYYVSKRSLNQDGTGSHSKIYIGETGDIAERFSQHHKQNCFEDHGANCISVHQEKNEQRRQEIEQDLIDAYKPPCNG